MSCPWQYELIQMNFLSLSFVLSWSIGNEPSFFVKGLSLEFTLQTIIIHTDRKTKGEGFFKFILGVFASVYLCEGDFPHHGQLLKNKNL